MAAEPFPFATLEELKERWPDFPAGADAHAQIVLEDASQFILDMVPSAADASPSTRRRVVCAVARRSMEASASGMSGAATYQATTGPFNTSVTPVNPNGDFYLTKAEKKALGDGAQKVSSVLLMADQGLSAHRPWCSLYFAASYCSCGVDIAGEPIFEGPDV
jgi:hypothetical protein